MAVLTRFLGLRAAGALRTDNEGRRSMPPGILLVNAQSGRERPRPVNGTSFPTSPYGVAHVLTACAECAVDSGGEWPREIKRLGVAFCERSHECL